MIHADEFYGSMTQEFKVILLLSVSSILPRILT